MGLRERLFGRAARPIAYPPALAEQVARAAHWLRAQTVAHDAAWQLREAKWSVDLDRGVIEFVSPMGVRASAPVQVVGEHHEPDQTWRWAWDDPAVDPRYTSNACKVRAYGQAHGFELLTTPRFVCTGAQCWELAALASMLCESHGAYAGPMGASRVFFNFGSVTLSKP